MIFPYLFNGFCFHFFQQIDGNNNVANSREDDWKTVFNEKAKYQAEKKGNEDTHGN